MKVRVNEKETFEIRSDGLVDMGIGIVPLDELAMWYYTIFNKPCRKIEILNESKVLEEVYEDEDE